MTLLALSLQVKCSFDVVVETVHDLVSLEFAGKCSSDVVSFDFATKRISNVVSLKIDSCLISLR